MIKKHNIREENNSWIAERKCPGCKETIIHKAVSFPNICAMLRKSLDRKCLSCRSTGRKLSEEAKLKISKSKKNLSQATREKLSKINKGKTPSKDIREKIRATLIGKKKKSNYIPNKGKGSTKGKPIIQYTLNNKFIQEWSSINKASKHLGISSSCISDVVNNKTESTFGFKWTFKN